MILLRIIFFPVKVVLGLLGFTLKIGYKAGTLPIKATAKTTTAVGLKGFFFFAVGVAVGLVLAPSSGADLRKKLLGAGSGEQLSDNELAEKVGFELSHAPRTWHLPQPEVAVVAGRVELSGSVPHEAGKDELERVAAAVPGVAAVENRIEVETEGNGSGEPADKSGNGEG
jgi:osmotically-inducible protein OsmY